VKCVINDQVVLSRAPDGPIAAHIGAFAESRTALGYARFDSAGGSARSGVQPLAQTAGSRLATCRLGSCLEVLAGCARRVRPCLGDAAALRHLIAFLRCEGVIAPEKSPTRLLTSAERCTEAYAQYLSDARAGDTNGCQLRAVRSGVPQGSIW
jgi:hypothetical protein